MEESSWAQERTTQQGEDSAHKAQPSQDELQKEKTIYQPPVSCRLGLAFGVLATVEVVMIEWTGG